ncbi:MAG: DNA repair protein RecO [Salinisphaera sp.]|nr:DNA repair protein RecO [Salinisphaera sp.]
MRVELTPALLLHRRPYRETSLLVEAFTRDHGRIGLVARGARRPRAPWRGLLEPLQLLSLSWTGRGDLFTLTQAEAARHRLVLAGEQLFAGFYASELVLRLIARQDPHPEVFDRLMDMLEQLARDVPAAQVLRLFERDLLAAIGYALPLRAESESGRAVCRDRHYHYHPRAGLRLAEGPAEPEDHRVSGAVLLALAAGEIKNNHAGPARRLLAAALAPHLHGRPLHSAETLRAMRRFRQSGDRR